MSSVEPQTPFNEYTGNGVSTVFPYEYQLLASSDLVVTIDGVLVPTSEYLLTGVGEQDGGDVIFTTAPLSGAQVLLTRTILLRRDIDYQYNGELPERIVDLDFNRLWQALQGFFAIIGGAVRAPFPEQIPPLPSASARANTLLGFDASGDPIVTTPNPSDATAVSLALAQFIADLASTALPALGDAMVGVKQTFTGAAARTQHNKNAETVSVSDVATGAVTPTNVSNLRAGTETIHLNTGITTGQLLLTDNAAGKSWSLLGKGSSKIDSANSTTLRHAGTVLNLADTVDYPSGSRIFSNFIAESTTSAPTLDMRYQHYLQADSLRLLSAAGGIALRLKDSWLNTFRNCYFQGDQYGAHIVGSCHSSKFDRCRFYAGAGGDAVRVDNLGTALDGNLSLLFDTCDFEFIDSNGINNVGGSQKLNLRNCYFENITGFSVINSGNGSVVVDGGSLAVGKQTTAAFDVGPGRITVRNARIYSELGAGTLQKLLRGSGGQIAFFDCELAGLTGASATWDGDVLAYGPAKRSLCKRAAQSYSSSAILTGSTPSAGVVRFTATGAAGFAEVRNFCSRDDYPFLAIDNIFVRYRSNVDFTIRTTAAVDGGAPVSAGITLPSTGGAIKTFIYRGKTDLTYANSVLVSIYRSGVVLNDYFEIHDLAIVSEYQMPAFRELYFPSAA